MHSKAIIDFNTLSSTFYVGLDASATRRIFEALFEKYGSWSEVRKRFVTYIDNRVFKGRYIRIDVLLSMLHDLNIDFESVRPHIMRIKSGDRGLPLINCLPISGSAELAALVAHAMGDGGLTKKRFEYTNTRPELIEKVSICAKSVFGFDNPYRRALRSGSAKPAFKLLYPSVIGRLLELAGAPDGNKTKKEFLVPTWILEGSMDVKKAFLRALFDDEGSVIRHRVGFIITKKSRFESNLIAFLKQLQTMLEEFGVDKSRLALSKSANGAIRGEIFIENLIRVEKFGKEIGFSHSLRKERLDNLLKIKRRVYARGESEHVILKTLSKGPMSTDDIAKAVKRERSTTYRWLSTLERKGKVKTVFPRRWKTELTWALHDFKGTFVPLHDAYHAIPLILGDGKCTASEIAAQTEVDAAHVLKYLRRYERERKIRRLGRTKNGILWALIGNGDDS